MLMFIVIQTPLYISGCLVSIHPMLMFIGIISKKQPVSGRVSIHPMLMFIKKNCLLKLHRRRFNTSYVNVYLSIFSKSSSNSRVSIHPMLMFIQRISAISKNNYTNFSSIYQLFSIFYQPITHFIVFK